MQDPSVPIINFSKLIPPYKQRKHTNYVIDSPDVIGKFIRSANIARTVNEIRVGFDEISFKEMN